MTDRFLDWFDGQSGWFYACLSGGVLSINYALLIYAGPPTPFSVLLSAALLLFMAIRWHR